MCSYSCMALVKPMEMLQQEKQCMQKYEEAEKLPCLPLYGPWSVTQDPSYYERPYLEGILVSEDLVLVLVED